MKMPRSALSVVLLAASAACSDEAPRVLELPAPLPREAPPGSPLRLEQAVACLADGDCPSGQRCFQSLCALAEAGSAFGPEVLPGLSIVRAPERVQRIAPGQKTVAVTLELSRDVPADGLAYRLERTDVARGVTPAVEHAQGDGREVTLTVPTGAADPASPEPAEVAVDVVTAAGTMRLVLTPLFTEDGGYGGEVVMATFGQLGLPIELSIVTDPPKSSLADARAVYLVLPLEDGNLWNPTSLTSGGPAFITRPLTFDRFTRAWVARFSLPYALAEGSPFAWVTGASDNHVSRSLRFELQTQGSGSITGRVSDRWSGLLEERSTGGVRRAADVVHEGTITLQRVAAPPTLEEVTPPTEDTAGAPGLLPAPEVDRCDGVDFVAECVDIRSAGDFTTAHAATQSACALAMVDGALASDTTAAAIQAYLDTSGNTGGRSFAEFMRACAAQRDGTCVPKPEVLCARQLAARALSSLPDGDPAAGALMGAYQRATREAFLGREFAAFYADADTRLSWLRAQDYPAIVTAAVRNLVETLLEAWRTQVLETHLEVLRGLFDSAGGAFLAQELVDPSAMDARRALLFEASQSWRGAAEAIALGASRWNTLLTDGATRTAKARYVADRSLDLYVIAGVLSEVNRRASAGGNNAVFEGGFRPILREARQLSLPFERLAYQRQGEVVVSTSLDPTASNDSLLMRLEASALEQVDRADTAVTEVVAQAQAELLQQAELNARLTSELQSLEQSLAELCGLPDGCAAPNDTTCQVAIEAGRCGFLRDAGGEILDAYPENANASEAGKALLEVRAALLALDRAEEAVRAHASKTELYFATTDAFADRVASWNRERQSLVSALAGKFAELAASRNAEVAQLAGVQAMQAEARAEELMEREAFIASWDQLAVAGVEDNFRRLTEAHRIEAASWALNSLAMAADNKAKAVAEGMPKVTGMANDVSAPARLAVLMSSFYVTKLMRAGAVVLKWQASRIERERERDEALRSAMLKRLEFESQLSAATTDATVEGLRNQARLITVAGELERETIQDSITLLERESNAELAYERDLVELRDRRDRVYAMTMETKGLEIQVLQAELTVQQALAQYERVVQRAQLVSGRLATVRNQAENINQIVGSPAAVFAWANRLTRAESLLEAAKDVLSDWVVALEYSAVRPFFDQRIQILLARNTTQLGQIAEELKRLQARCGGPQNEQTVELSVRSDLLGITSPTIDLTTSATVSAGQRFRNVLAAGRIPIDKRVRHANDATVGDLLNRGGVLAATFDLSADDFANLGNTCNAKMGSFAIALVGEGLGDARPTVSVLYDGTSKLRSCQPNIRELVATIGADVTPFAEITSLRTVGRSVSPVAGVNALPPVSSDNRSLGGLPLVSQYTVLIDPMAGENRRIDWSKLEDLQLRVQYTYQDLFPAGQCQ